MDIAIIGSGNVGTALASRWKEKHRIVFGVRDPENFKGKEKIRGWQLEVLPVADAVARSGIVVLAVPAMAAAETARSLGPTSGKIIIDTMNIVMGRGPEGYANTSAAILDNTDTREVVKCFNTTGFNNMENPLYGDRALDMFMAGDSAEGKTAARQLALDAGFAECHDAGGSDRFTLMEQFAFFWINLAMFQGQGREIGFVLLRR